MATNGASFNKSESESQTSKQFATTVSRLNSKQMFDEVTKPNPFEGNSVLLGDIMFNVKNGIKVDEDIYESVLKLEQKMDTIITMLSKLCTDNTVKEAEKQPAPKPIIVDDTSAIEETKVSVYEDVTNDEV